MYTVASKFAELVQLPGLAVNYVLYPDFAREDRRSAARRTAALILPALAVSVLAALPLALIAGTALPWVFGDVFDDAVVPTYIRLAGVVTFGVTGLIMAYLYGVGRPGAASTGQGIGLLVVVALGAFLIPAYGAEGAAVATSVSFIATTAALLAWQLDRGTALHAERHPEAPGALTVEVPGGMPSLEALVRRAGLEAERWYRELRRPLTDLPEARTVPGMDIVPFTWIPGVIWFLLKVAFVFFVFAMVKAIVPRYRYDQLMRLGWKVFLPLSLFMVVAVAAVLHFFDLAP